MNPDTGLFRLVSIGLGDKHVVEPLLDSNNLIRRGPVLSPNGQLLAYVQRTAGQDQVYVQPFPAGGTPVLVSQGGAVEGMEPIWGSSSTELFYRDGVNMMEVRLETTPSLRVKQRTALFPIRFYYGYLNAFVATHDFDPSTDRFLMSRYTLPELPGNDIQVVRNAFDLINRLAPRK